MTSTNQTNEARSKEHERSEKWPPARSEPSSQTENAVAERRNEAEKHS